MRFPSRGPELTTCTSASGNPAAFSRAAIASAAFVVPPGSASVVVLISIRIGKPPSRMLMPLAFAAHAGSMLALTGTPVNILVSDAAQEATGAGFNFFEFALVGADAHGAKFGGAG